MEKSTVTIKFDQEKTEALRVYLGHKDSCTEAEIEKALDALYVKVVPNEVKKFLAEKAELNTKKKEG